MKLYSINSLLLCIHYKNQEFQGIYIFESGTAHFVDYRSVGTDKHR